MKHDGDALFEYLHRDGLEYSRKARNAEVERRVEGHFAASVERFDCPRTAKHVEITCCLLEDDLPLLVLEVVDFRPAQRPVPEVDFPVARNWSAAVVRVYDDGSDFVYQVGIRFRNGEFCRTPYPRRSAPT